MTKHYKKYYLLGNHDTNDNSLSCIITASFLGLYVLFIKIFGVYGEKVVFHRVIFKKHLIKSKSKCLDCNFLKHSFFVQ